MKCRIKNCSGQVQPDSRPGLGGLCADHVASQLDRERRTGEHEKIIRRSLRPANQRTFDLWNIGPTRPEYSNEALALADSLLESEGPRFPTLKKAKELLKGEEREQAMKAGAVWNMGNSDKPSCAIWKANVNGKTWYVCHTHRCFQSRPTLKGAIKAFEFVKSTG